MFEKVFPMKKSVPVNLNDYPCRVIEIDRNSSFQAKKTVSGNDKMRMCFNNCDYDEENDTSIYPDDDIVDVTHDDYDENDSYVDDYSLMTMAYDEYDTVEAVNQELEPEPYLQQFDQIDFAGTDWNSYDLNRIVF